MKRKIVNGLLLMAFTVSSVSSFVACKDYDEDVYVDVKTRIDKEATLREALQTQVDNLEALVKSMETCKCELKGYLTAEQANLDQYLTKAEAATKYMTEEQVKAYVKSQPEYTDYSSRISAIEASIATLQSAINTINSKLGQVDVNTQEIAKQAGQISALNTTLLAVQSTANEAIDLAKKAATTVDLTDLTTRIENLSGLIAGWDAKLTSVSTTAENAAAKAAANAALIAANRYSVDSLAKVVKDMKNGGEVINLTEIQNRLKAIEDDYIKSGDLDKVRLDLEAAVQQAQLLAQLAMDLATVNSGRIDEIDGCTDCLISRIVALENFINNLPATPGTDFTTTTEYTTIINNITNIQNDITNIQNDITNLNGKYTTLDGKVDGIDTRVSTLESALGDYVKNDVFKAAIDRVNGRVDSLAEVTAAIEAKVANVVLDIQNMITEIRVDAAESPVVGYLNTPVGIDATILAVYYGNPTEDWEFPATSATPYVNGTTDFAKWTPRNIQIIGALTDVEGYISGSAGTTLITQNNGSTTGNAGTLYVTVNPANVDFSGKVLKVKDSQDADAPVTLSPLARSDRQLTFGYTRAAENGFYETQATLTDVAKAQLNLDYNAIKEDAQELLKDKTKASALELGSTLLKNVQDVLPAYSVMGSWTDKSSGVEHKLYSQYNVAVMAVKPLSLAFLQDWKGVSKMPGLDRVQNLVGEIIDKIDINVNLGLPDFAKYKGSIEFKDITLPTISDDLLHITYYKKYTSDDLAGKGDIAVSSDEKTDLYFLVTNKKDSRYALVSTNADGSEQQLYIYNPATDSYHKATAAEEADWGAIDFELEVNVDINKTPELKSTLQDIVDELNANYGGESKLAKNITDLLNDVASLDKLDDNIEASIDGVKGDIKKQLNKYISRANTRLTKWFNRAPGLLHLAVVQSNKNGAGLLSTSKKGATKASGAVKLIPTTYNLELVAPTYKKFIAVTDVYNADGTAVDIATAKTMAAAANGTGMGKVIDGNKICTLNAGQSGYIYQITYTAIDYFGKVAIRKYYVRF